jgi:predicted transcriptional regulator
MTSITVRIPDDLKKDIDTLGVEVSDVTRSALASEVQRLKRKRAEEAAKKLSRLLADVPDETIIKAVRETREER